MNLNSHCGDNIEPHTSVHTVRSRANCGHIFSSLKREPIGFDITKKKKKNTCISDLISFIYVTQYSFPLKRKYHVHTFFRLHHIDLKETTILLTSHSFDRLRFYRTICQYVYILLKTFKLVMYIYIHMVSAKGEIHYVNMQYNCV